MKTKGDLCDFSLSKLKFFTEKYNRPLKIFANGSNLIEARLDIPPGQAANDSLDKE
jgi:hypothetical protein